MRHLHLLHNALVAAGIPVRGLRRANNELTIDYLDTATDAQIEAAADIVDAWDGEAEDAAEDRRLQALRELEDIDLASIRALREYVAAQPGAPIEVVTLEARAEAERETVRDPKGGGR